MVFRLRCEGQGRLAQLVRAIRLHRIGQGFESLSAHCGLLKVGKTNIEETSPTRRNFITSSMASTTNSSETLMAGSGSPVPVPIAPATPAITLWRWSVEKYHEMVRAGIIDEDDPVELLEGWIVKKMTTSPLHRTVTGLLRDVLQRVMPEGWFVDSQDPVTLAASEPEPDVVLVRGSRLDFLDHHPGPGDVALVVEVSDSGLSRDRVFKKSIYAAAGIAVYWVVNLVDRRLEVYSECTTSASGTDYARCDCFAVGDKVPLVVEGQTVAEIPLAAILP